MKNPTVLAGFMAAVSIALAGPVPEVGSTAVDTTALFKAELGCVSVHTLPTQVKRRLTTCVTVPIRRCRRECVGVEG
jgi:hypothetical protein